MFPQPDTFVAREGNGRDAWETWSPNRGGWTDVGSPTVAGRWQQRGRLVLAQVRVTPETTCATTAGTSYVALPIAATGFGGCFVMVNATTNVAVGVCVVDVANSRIYVPTQSATGNTLVITGWYEV